ncbi:MAG: AIPR family protein [Bacteroidota bacterium]|nr:AIPR family protein [Bacteroidota bacterium]
MPNINDFKLIGKKSEKYFNLLTNELEIDLSETVNAKKRVKLTIKSFQVLNGGQTLRTIHSFNKQDNKNIEEYIANSEVLVRIFKTTTDEPLNNKIAEFTNSQNSISNIDLKSLRSEQIQIEQFLDEHNIIYSRKTGDTGLSETKNYIHKISMERFGQILFSLKGYPDKASNQKKQIFDKYYDDIFSENNLNIAKSPEQVSRYFEIKREYERKNNNYKSSDQKIFYILYLDTHLSLEIPELISIFESLIQEYIPSSGNTVSDARKLIQLKFKEFIDTELNIIKTV